MERHIRFSDEESALVLLDQRYLPTREDDYYCRTVENIIYALQTMVVRGAPAIGVTAAYGCWIAAKEVAGSDNWKEALQVKLEEIAEARPTAVNLRWGVERMKALWESSQPESLEALMAIWLEEAKVIHKEDIAICKLIGVHGATVIDDGDTVMTHCNAGALATAGYGTALGVVRGAVDAGKKDISVIANETRPFLQGARLTAYELKEDNIPVSVACDNACGLLMRRGMVDKVVVGADRVAANGDAVNKIGTYSVALLAKAHNVPFYVAAPLSTIDRNMPDGDSTPIEDRTPLEVTHVGETQITPDDVPVYNFAFDPTPHELIAGIVTEVGVLRPPFAESIKKAFEEQSK
ncbi:S-methyl-5-thioribose-1-phosphate isomerase [Halodesulfovibrio sp.]|uniref:S-methyl-5-thioribose-1-phosphate isomerase n=1 Tax=Halodesulfovibrio sp. TaxID=1912772 RepID=UPI0025BCB89E|nr:S-methyl-5-thioribose-1-phosphate isomerase [Halodesulfovibrio sp.]